MSKTTLDELQGLVETWLDRAMIYRNMGERGKADAYAKAAKELRQRISQLIREP